MDTHDVFTVNFSVEFLWFAVVTRETLGAMGDVNSTINSSFHGAEDTGSGGGASQTNIQVGTESSRTIFSIFNSESSTSYFSGTLVQGVKFEFFQQLKQSYFSIILH